VVVEENNLHTQVSAVRKIVGRAAIATIAGLGYRFVAPVVVVSMDTVSAPSIERERLPPLSLMPGAPGVASAGRLSIAVIPFANMSGDPEQEYFSDGITEDIITGLSKTTALPVVARNSSLAYKHKGGDVRTIGRELGVGSILEGSIRRAGERLRITAQLIDTTTGTHLWAERYDRDIADIFAIQDDVTRRIVDALMAALRPLERAQPASARAPGHRSPRSFSVRPRIAA
jgi:TolB-like protein